MSPAFAVEALAVGGLAVGVREPSLPSLAIEASRRLVPGVSEASLAPLQRRRTDLPALAPSPSRRGSTASAAPLLLALVLLLMAALVAPEQPQDQEAICQRHNGALACRIW